MQKGRDKETAALNLWYKTQKEKYAGHENALSALLSLYREKRTEINKKYDDIELKEQEKRLRDSFAIEKGYLELEGADESAVLEKKKEMLHKIAGLYAEGSPERNKILQQIALLQFAIEKAFKKEQKAELELDLKIDDAKFAEQLETLENKIQSRKKTNLLQTMFGMGEMEAPDFSALDERVKRQKELLAQTEAEIRAAQKDGDIKTAKEKQLVYSRLNTDLLSMQRERAAGEIEIERQKNQTIKEMSSMAWNQMTSLVNQYYANKRAKAQEDIEKEYEGRFEALDTERQKAMRHAFTETQKARINKQFDDKEKALEEKKQARLKKAQAEGFEIQKGISIAETIMNTATAVMKAWATAGPIAGPILSGIIAALGAAQIAMISSQQPPGFSEGGLFEGEGGPTDDQNIIRVSDGEYIVNSAMTGRYLKYLDMINNDRFGRWLAQNKRLAVGGLFEGEGGPTDDQNIIRVSDGEYIVNSAMTGRYLKYLDMINNDRFGRWLAQNKRLAVAPGFSSGGRVGGGAVVYNDSYNDEMVKQLKLINNRLLQLEESNMAVAGRPVEADARIEKYITKAVYESGAYLSAKMRL